MSTMTSDDAQLFYKLWFSLLEYVNKKHKVNPSLKKMADAKQLDPQEVSKVADYLWEHVEEIDDYLTENKDLPEEHRSLIAAWKKRVRGRFVLERHLKKGSILLGEDNRVYLVGGIVSSWEEMFFGFSLPVFVSATLIPWRGGIISDGLIGSYPIMIGGNMKRGFKDIYMEAKNAGEIISSLTGDVAQEQTRPNVSKKSDPAPGKRAVKKEGKTGNRYRLKVYPAGMSREVYREIGISGRENLDTLAEFIVESFGFIHEHLYEFCMDNRMFSDDSYQADPEPGERSTRTRLDTLKLVKGQNFTLHYDFGDDWMFVIHVKGITAEPYAKPELLREKGEIEQYPDWG